MALERRGNGYYFYEKKRIGNRVVSIYSGDGEAEKLRQNEIDQLIESTCEAAKTFEDVQLPVTSPTSIAS